MFVNGIALIADLLGIREELDLNDIEAMRCPEAYIKNSKHNKIKN